MKKCTPWIIYPILSVTILLWASSYTHHTAVGIDHDFEHSNRILHVFYRVTWTGNGSIWAGYGSVWKNKDKSLEKFDLAAVFFRKNTKPLKHQTQWNKLGFWYINADTPKPVFWIGIPSWLPVLLLLFFPIFNWLYRNNVVN